MMKKAADLYKDATLPMGAASNRPTISPATIASTGPDQ
jgi:hypothetical protein